MTRPTRPVSWINAARKAFESFPEGAQAICVAALTIAAEGGKADVAKPMKGLGSGISEIALAYRGNAFRVVYAVQLGADPGWCMRFRRSPHRGSRPRSTRSTLFETD